jgi:Flp pilus assembly pilin Flp
MLTETHRPAERMTGDAGAGLVEYSLLIALIMVVCIGVLVSFGKENGGLVNGSASSIQTATHP